MRGAGRLTILLVVAALAAACGAGGGQTETQAPADEAAQTGVTHTVEPEAPDTAEPDAPQPSATVAQSVPAPVDYAPHEGTRREGVPAVGRTLGHPSAPILVEEWSDFQ